MTICRSKRSWRRILSVSMAMLALVSPIVSVHASEAVGATPAQHDKARIDGENRGSAWIEFRDEMLRCGIEATITGFLVWFGNPPPQLDEMPPDQITPPSDPPSDPPPDTPTGGGEDTPINPPFDPPPPDETPEPASLITALLGVGLTSIYAWRRKRRQ